VGCSNPNQIVQLLAWLPVQPPSSSSAKRRSCRKIPERFCPVSETACLVVNGSRETPNWHPRVSTRQFQRSLQARTAAPSKSIQTTKWYFAAVHRDKRFRSSFEETRVFKSHVRLYLDRCLLSFHFVSILVIFQIHHPREYIQSVYPNYIQNRTNWISDYNIDPDSVRLSKIWFWIYDVVKYSIQSACEGMWIIS